VYKFNLFSRVSYTKLNLNFICLKFQINLISIEDPLTGSAFFKSIQNGLNSNDRFEILRFIEIIGGLCQTTLNEPILCDFLDKTVFH